MKPRSPAPENCRAFSLIEIAIALGIFSFAIVAIIGLLSVSLNSDQGAGHDSTLARMAEATLSGVRTQGFAQLHTNSAYAVGAPAQFFYDSAGQIALDSSGRPLSSAQPTSRYQCRVTRTASASPHLDYLYLEFRWPLHAPADRQQRRVIHTSLADYD